MNLKENLTSEICVQMLVIECSAICVIPKHIESGVDIIVGLLIIIFII